MRRTGGEGRAARPRRARDAAATRAAILAAARRLIVRDGYAAAGMREIAAAAGVTAALAVRYFGSKEELLAAAAAGPSAAAALLEGDPAGLPERLARHYLRGDPAAAGFDPLVALVRSAQDRPAAGILGGVVSATLVRPLAARLAGPHAAERAGLAAALLAGLVLLRRAPADPPPGAHEDMLVALAVPALRTLLDGTGPESPDGPGNNG